EGASPSIAVLAVRRKFVTVTPGISTGYCIARNRPARARSSTLISSTSSPSRVMVPPVTVYLGCPAIVDASVDLPDPFGPMIACVSPLRMVRFTPLRMGVVPSSVSTVTCRSRISRTAMSVFLLHVDVNEHVVAVDLDGVDRDGLVSREVEIGRAHV